MRKWEVIVVIVSCYQCKADRLEECGVDDTPQEYSTLLLIIMPAGYVSD